MYILIIGCGRLGSTISQDLANSGHDICIIDRDAEKLRNLGTGFNGQRIQGIEFDNDNLLSGGIHQAEVLLALTPDDNINITVCLVAAKIHHVARIIARVNDPARKYIYDTLGIEIINPTQLSAEILESCLTTGHSMHTVFLDAEYDVSEFSYEKPHIESLDIFESKFNCKVILVKRNGDKMLTNSMVHLQSGDILVCVYPNNAKEKLFRAFNREG